MSSLTRVLSHADVWEMPPSRPDSWEKNAHEVTKALEESPTPETLIALLQRFPDYELRRGGRLGWTTLAIAIKKNQLPLVRAILDLAPTLVNRGWRETGSLPYLVTAAGCGSLAIVQELLSRRAQVNLATPTGNTALQAACDEGHLDVVQHLVKRGGVIYQKAREAILNDEGWAQESVNQVKRHEVVLRDALLPERMFLNEKLSKASRHALEKLPIELKLRIVSYF